MAIVIGSVFLKLMSWMPGHEMKLLLFMALWNVSMAGEKAQAFKYCANSAEKGHLTDRRYYFCGLVELVYC